MNEILSKKEIDNLLSAVEVGDFGDSSGSKTDDYLNESFEDENVKKSSVRMYDFKRPDKFSKDQIRTIQMIHETYARLTTTSLSAQLRSFVNIRVVSVDQLTYEEFSRSIPNPSTLAIINMDPLKGSLIMEIDPNITFVIIDRLFGGEGQALKDNRELTDIELSVIEGVVIRILGNLREAWSNAMDLRPKLGNIETNIQFTQIVPPNDMVVLITLEIKIGATEGIMNFCIPYITIESIISKLSAQYWYSSIRKKDTHENLDLIKDQMYEVSLDLIAKLGSIPLSVNELMKIKAGDVIKLNTKTNSELDLLVGSKKKYDCYPGRIGNKLGVQITKTIQDEQSEKNTIEGDLENG